MPVWDDEEGQELRKARKAADLSIGQAAILAGLRPAEISYLETGRMTFENSEDKKELLALYKE